MSIHRRATRRDKNEDAIVSALEAAGASVTRLGVEGVPDLLVGIEGRTYLLEVKAPLGARGGVHSNSTSLKSRGGDGVRTAAQVAWWAAWRGAPPVIVRTPAEALEAIGARVEAREADRAQLAAAGFAYDPDQPPAKATVERPRIRAKPEACRERTAHAIQPDRDECACGNAEPDLGAAVTLRCTGCSLEYEGKMGYADGLRPPIHWTGDEDQTKRPLCAGFNKDGVPAIRFASAEQPEVATRKVRR